VSIQSITNLSFSLSLAIMVANEGRAKNLYAVEGNSDDRNEPNIAERDGHLVPEMDDYGYRIHEQAYGTRRRIKVVLMGAGASTLNFLKQAEDELQNVDITVYEKNSDVGGTWLEVGASLHACH
jgi:hypothetical protein